MKFNYDCLHCHINQGLKVAKWTNLNTTSTEDLLRSILSHLSKADFTLQNPEIMSQTWQLITGYIDDPDPYKAFKEDYNHMLHSISDQLKKEILSQDLYFRRFMYAAILGNIIDLGPSHEFETDNWLKRFKEELGHIKLGEDDSAPLFHELSKAKTLLYVGDNCGEIVLDRIFIEYLKHQFQDLTITYATRGLPILNDITLKDAQDIGMEKVANLISSGVDTPGLILNHASEDFLSVYHQADLIIAKGQGNYEALSDQEDPRIFHLFMVKCPLIARETGVPNLSKMCYRQKKLSPKD